MPRAVSASVAALALGALLLTGCSGTDESGTGDNQSNVATGQEGFEDVRKLAARLGTDAAPGEFPRTVRNLVANEEVGETVIPAKPERVIVLDTGELDTLASLGIEPVGIAHPADVGMAPGYLDVGDAVDLGPYDALDLEHGTLRTWVGVGGSPESVVRAARHGLPLTLAIIGGDPLRFLSDAQLYRQSLERLGRSELPIAVHSPGHVARTDEDAREQVWPHYQAMMSRIGAERGWAPATRAQFDREAGPNGALCVGALMAMVLAFGDCKRSPPPTAVTTDIPVSVSPAPAKVERATGVFVINADTKVTFGDGAQAKRVAEYFSGRLEFHKREEGG